MNSLASETANGDLISPGSVADMNEPVGILVPSRPRLIQLFILLLGVVVVNFWAFGHWHDEVKWLIGLSILLVFEVTVIARVSGCSDDPTWMKWAILVWVFALLNLQLASVAASTGNFLKKLPLVAMYAGQYGLVITWLITGTNHIVNRIAVSFLLLSGLLFGSLYLLQYEWFMVMVCFVIALVLNLLILRFFGFRMHRVQSSGASDFQPAQFALRHVMMITTVFALMMGAIKSQEIQVVRNLVGLANVGTLIIFALGCASAIVLIVACWSGLGEGHYLARYGLFLLSTGLVGVGVSLWMVSLDRGIPFGPLSNTGMDLWRIARAKWYWLAWFLLSGAMFVASLTFFRSQGLRFARVRAK